MNQNSEPVSINKVADIFDNLKEYTDLMRSSKDSETIPRYLWQYAWNSFRDADLSKKDLRVLSVYFVDGFYKALANDLDVFDEYVKAYISAVVPFIWDSLQNRGVDVFYLVDNNFDVPDGDIRLKFIIELFELSGFAVVTPYNMHNELVSFKVVNKKIKNYLSAVRMIMYLEKDARVAYSDNVVELATSTDYVCVGRSKSADIKDITVISGIER